MKLTGMVAADADPSSSYKRTKRKPTHALSPPSAGVVAAAAYLLVQILVGGRTRELEGGGEGGAKSGGERRG